MTFEFEHHDFESYWEFVSKVNGEENKRRYLITNYSLVEQIRLNNARLYLEREIEAKLYEEFVDGFYLYVNLAEEEVFHISNAISHSTTNGKTFYYDLVFQHYRIFNYFDNQEYGEGYHLIWEYQEKVLVLMSNKIKNFMRTVKNRKQNKAARVIQLKFLDWFYKPVCKDGTFGLNCLLAKQICMKQLN
jgi:hypothetical protein